MASLKIRPRVIDTLTALVILVTGGLFTASVARGNPGEPEFSRFTDPARDTVLTVGLRERPTLGLFAFDVPGRGIFWSEEPAGIRFSGRGRTVAQVTFDGAGFLLPTQTGSDRPDPLPADFRLSAVVEAGEAAALAHLWYGPERYLLATGAMERQAGEVAGRVTSLLESADWAGLYSLLGSGWQSQVDPAQFGEGLEMYFASLGEPVTIRLASAPAYDPADPSALPTAQARVVATFVQGGSEQTVVGDLRLVLEDGEWRLSAIRLQD